MVVATLPDSASLEEEDDLECRADMHRLFCASRASNAMFAPLSVRAPCQSVLVAP